MSVFDVDLTTRFKQMDQGTFKLALCFIFAVVSVVLIAQRYPDSLNKLLKRELFQLPAVTIDLWSVTHFCTYSVLGYLFPDYLLELFALGIGWEIVEDALSPTHNKLLVDCDANYNNKVKEWFKNLWCKHAANEKAYWYAKWDDLFSNALGLLVGHYIRLKKLPTFPHINLKDLQNQLIFK